MIKCNYGVLNSDTFYKVNTNYNFTYHSETLRDYFFQTLFDTEEESQKEIELIKEKFEKLLFLIDGASNCMYFKQAFVLQNEIFAVGYYRICNDVGSTFVFGYVPIEALYPMKFISLYDNKSINFGFSTIQLVYEPQFSQSVSFAGLRFERDENKIIIRDYRDNSPVDLIELDSYNKNNEIVSIVGDLSSLNQRNIDSINILLMELYNSQRCMFVSIDNKWELTLV